MKPLSLFLSICITCVLGSCAQSRDMPENIEAIPLTTNSVVTSEHDASVYISDDEVIDNFEIERLTIGAEKVECEGFHLQQCFLVQRGHDTNPTYFYDEIEGFDYEWGYRYDLIVSKYIISSAVADRSQYTYELIDVVSKTEEDQKDTFDYVARYGRASINKYDQTTYQLVNRNYFICEIDLCAAVDATIDQEQAVVLKFRHSKEPGGLLQLVAVSCADDTSEFTNNCLHN